MGKKIPAKIKKSVRFVALDTLERVNKGGAYSNLLLNDMMSKAKLSEKDGRLYTELVYGTISRRLLLEFYLQPFIAKAKKVDDWVVTLLCLSLYQLEVLDKVPAHAVLNEAVEIGKARGNAGIGKFVNGVLRSIQREGVPELDSIKDSMTRLSVEISMPLWLTKKLVNQLGVEETRKLGRSLFEVSHVSARVDTRMVEREDVIATLEEEEGIFARESEVSPYGVVAEKGYLANSRLFQYGLMTIQDESSMLVAPTMQIQKHHKVLDACAAPGGKTTHIATFLDPLFGGEVTALDIHDHKVKLIEDNARRLRVEEAVHAKKMDARTIHEQFEQESFDRILVDAPCSGLGLMRRKPDIKYHKKPEDFLQLQKIQLEILESAAPTLKHSGIMTYSTCTITEEENQKVIETFLEAHPEFEKVEVTVNPQIQDAVSDNQLTLYPHQFMTDGFFICCLRKK